MPDGSFCATGLAATWVTSSGIKDGIQEQAWNLFTLPALNFVRCLMQYPQEQLVTNAEVFQKYQSNAKDFELTAREWAEKYASSSP